MAAKGASKPARERVTVLFPITDLARDGAQRQLFELVKGLDKGRFRPIILTLQPGGPMEREFSEVPEAQVIALNRRGKIDFLCLLSIIGILRSRNVDVVQPFLTPATFFGLLPALVCRVPVKIVTERAGPRNGNTGRGYRLYLKIEDLLSRFADRAIANSQAGVSYLVQRGINPSRTGVIYNGIDLDRLTPDSGGVDRVRQRMDVPPGGKVVGMTARLFPVKNHALFLRAAAMVSEVLPDTRFALLGDGPLRSDLEQLGARLGLSSKIVFLGEQRDVASCISAFDIAAMTSDTEGCSNSLLEAMALGKPVVATDVGGNREIVRHGETGILVSTGHPPSLAEAIITLLRDPEAAQAMGQRASETVRARFSLGNMVHQYESLYEEALSRDTA